MAVLTPFLSRRASIIINGGNNLYNNLNSYTGSDGSPLINQFSYL